MAMKLIRGFQGIVFSIIIVRIGLGVATGPETTAEATPPRVVWLGTRQEPHELSTFAAPGDIEQRKSGDWQGVRVTISSETEVEHREASKDATHMI